jgi:hypothetical protein
MFKFLDEKKEILLILLIQISVTIVVFLSIHRTNLILIFAIYEISNIVFSISIFKIGRKKHKGEIWWKIIFGFDFLFFVFALPIFFISLIALLFK